ncbi:tetratricopeptide repeat-containing sensor histidine kinase [Reichenbachiella agariperforans]|uniref:tetratricopeptide repeat-containing sensor histidine kinase n=1 Tax=Reichenbachiella agariperforans TaxID=156994 RepID=UPI001C081BA9|nr:tetratricopeptide repeat-containing sensor histidine kinase [Reichenbachiella agariperforans]MBU2914473.1 tetratricopeptide repeat protein [Reichenbachiella agariperforans]
MKNLTILLLTCVSLAPQLVFAQPKSLSPTQQQDSITIKSLQGEAWQLKYSDPRKSMLYLDSAAILAQNVSPKITADVIYYKAMINYLINDYPLAIDQSQQALAKYESVENHYGQASIYNLLGLINQRIGNYDDAVHAFHRSLSEAEFDDNLYAQSNPIHNIALVYLDMHEYKTSMEYAQKAYAIRHQIGDSTLIGQSLQTIGGLSYHLQHYDQSIAELNQSIAIFEKHQDWSSLSISYSNLGMTYQALKSYERAKDYFHESAKLSKQVEDDEGLTSALVNLSSVSVDLGDYRTAAAYAREAIEITEKFQLRPTMKDALELLAIAQENLNNPSAALQTMKQTMALSDSLINSEKSNQIAALETKFKVKEKEQEIALQKAELEIKNAQLKTNRYLLIILTGGTLLILFIVWQQKKKSKLKEQARLSETENKAKKDQITAALNSQEQERSRFAKDLHDNMGQLISVMNLSIDRLQKAPNIVPSERTKTYELCNDILGDMYKELKNICFDLMPQSLTAHGLVNALQEFALRVNSIGDLQIEVLIHGGENFPAHEKSVALYRIAQEWVNNIIKYSDAKNITLQIIQDEEEVLLMIEDDGMGFDQKLLISGKGYGWKNIQSRVAFIVGSLDLDTQSGRRGNTFTVAIPRWYFISTEELSESPYAINS